MLQARVRRSLSIDVAVVVLLPLLAVIPAAPGPAAAGPAAAGPPARVIVVPSVVSPGIVTECWRDVRYFNSLRTGTVDYCRGHLAYSPGAFDCYQFTDQVCTVFLPDTASWTETRSGAPPVLFPCPDAPLPPVCPRLTWH